MKIENEITGEIREIKENYVGVRLYVGKAISDSFAVDIEGKEIVTMLDTVVKNLLNIENTFEAYMKLIADLGLDIQQPYKKHWIPSPNDKYFCIGSTGEVYESSYYDEVSWSDNKRKQILNYNAFPSKELAEKAVNLSKLGRLILLWQYANNFLFEPDWNNVNQDKFSINLDHSDKKAYISQNQFIQNCGVYFETKKQAESFINMYEEKIIKRKRVINYESDIFRY